ncbi:MAG: bifunctional DNA-formamidopyrimidine glycosylase/DNA-(apurinic or apyrimidinic site) lyase [Hyphomicrobiaceae bacterium]|nr:bifunctional DNA-formamidopyrimidine glycosylase/DNA-(apurinic or apyrimidinic site) lyase [Hyphomicrobiaceae bacterium]
MPELPEVETVRRGLEPVLVGRALLRVDARRPDLRFPLPAKFSARLEGRVFERLDRRAKYLVGHLDSGEALIMHLGMTGRFTISNGGDDHALGQYVYDQAGDPRHDHVVFHFPDDLAVVYNDPRRFGFMVMTRSDELERHPLMRELGPEPLSEALTADYLSARAAGKKVNLKAFLMDQHVVAGLGNIYVSEALFRARLSPDRAASSLAARGGAARAAKLVRSIKDVLDDAITAGGSTLRDYRHADGSRGGFQEKFFVYDRDGERCQRDGCRGVLRRAVHQGRATFYCPVCQR